MSHATLTVFLPGTLSADDIEAELEKVMAPYDEGRETPRYVKATKAELIAEEKRDFETYREGTYADFLADPLAYAEKTGNLRHLLYLAGGDYGLTTNYPDLIDRYMKLVDEDMAFERDNIGNVRGRKGIGEATYTPMPFEQSFPARFGWSDDQFYTEAIRWYEPSELGPEGEVYSEYNPKSKWDWYVIGGRWAKYWSVHPKGAEHANLTHDSIREFAEMAARIRPGAGSADREYADKRDARDGDWVDVARKFDIDFDKSGPTFALLDSEGEWHEKGRMGWFGVSTGDKPQDEWSAQYADLVAKESDNSWVILVDYHI